MYRALIALCLAAAASAAAANQLEATTFEDQWEREQTLTADTRWLIFSHHRDGGEWVKAALDTLGVSDPAARRWLYVADISAMPGIITRMFAIPGMRDYAFPVALVRQEGITDSWPRREEQVAVYRLRGLAVAEVHHFPDARTLTDFLGSL